MKKVHPIDTNWFIARMTARGLSINGLAPRLTGHRGPMTYSNFYRLLHGEYAMTLIVATELAEILGVRLDEIARRALGKRR